MDFTKLFTEQCKLLAKIDPASYNSEQNTARVSLANYNRVVVLLGLGALGSGTTVDMDIEQHTAASGGSTKNIAGKSITQLTQAGSDANKVVAVEIDAADLDVAGGYDYISAEIIPATSTAILWAMILGFAARFEPVGSSDFDEVVT